MTRYSADTAAAPRAVRRIAARAFIAAMASLSMIAALAATAHAQDSAAPRPHFEFVLHSGKLLPTGAQRGAISRANVSAAQLSYVVHPSVALTTTLGWGRSRDVASAGDPRLDVFTYDVGTEIRAPHWTSVGRVRVSPFGGVGAGGRSYNHRSLDVDATHNLAAYGSAGAELGYRRLRLRLEAREYVTGFRPLSGGGATDARNDVAFLFGLRIVR